MPVYIYCCINLLFFFCFILSYLKFSSNNIYSYLLWLRNFFQIIFINTCQMSFIMMMTLSPSSSDYNSYFSGIMLARHSFNFSYFKLEQHLARSIQTWWYGTSSRKREPTAMSATRTAYSACASLRLGSSWRRARKTRPFAFGYPECKFFFFLSLKTHQQVLF